MPQIQRLKNLDSFTANTSGFLIATDVAARGLDIPCVEHLVHYQVSRTSESYVHRSRRTARALRQGLSVFLLVEPKEQGALRKLCLTVGRGANTEDTIPSFPVDSSRLAGVKQRVSVARDLDKLRLQTRYEKILVYNTLNKKTLQPCYSRNTTIHEWCLGKCFRTF